MTSLYPVCIEYWILSFLLSPSADSWLYVLEFECQTLAALRGRRRRCASSGYRIRQPTVRRSHPPQSEASCMRRITSAIAATSALSARLKVSRLPSDLDLSTSTCLHIVISSVVGTTLRIIGDNNCFYIDPITGWIHVKANLKRSPCRGNSYTFDVIAEDASVPPQQSNQVRVTVDIVRNRFAPEINNLPANVTIGKLRVIVSPSFRTELVSSLWRTLQCWQFLVT